MSTLQFKTDLSCESCVETLKPFFKDDSEIESWNVDLKSPDKILTVTGKKIDESHVSDLVEKAGYNLLGKVEDHLRHHEEAETKRSFLKTYYPLILIFSYILGFTLLKQISFGRFDIHEAMSDFMGGFFAVFSFFKILNLKGFVDAYSTYDIIAKRSQTYAYIYPFLELAIGIMYLGRFNLIATSGATVALMSVSSVGVIQSVAKKSKIQCACLGTIFKLPMTYITLFEDLLMAGMALVMLSF